MSFQYEWDGVKDRNASPMQKRLWRHAHKKKGKRVFRGGKFRPALDPFVSFYLTRAIPNAVWRRTERFISQKSGNTIQRSSGRGFEI